MLPEIKTAFLGGRLMLLLGAGASYGSLDADNNELPMGDALAEELAGLMKWSYNGEALGNVYSAVNAKDSAKLHSFLRRRFTNTKPSREINTLARFPWSRIFTLNIDDCMERALRRANSQRVDIFGRASPLEEQDPIFNTVQVIKLNGSADRPEDGFIFSPQEYGAGSSRLPVWYRELGQNYSNYVFVFVGSKLNEPLFQHALAEMRSTNQRHPLQGYVITPSSTEIERHHLTALNLVHVPATLRNFTDWLEAEIPAGVTGWDLATARRPELRNISRALNETQKRALNSVTLVSESGLPRLASASVNGAIREFYKGYKPTWRDVVDGVPAELNTIKEFTHHIQERGDEHRCFGLIGPAGSGKTTTLMKAAINLSKNSDFPVYFLREAVTDIKEVMIALEQVNSGRFYVFIDKIESMAADLADHMGHHKARNARIVFSERQTIWNRRIKVLLNQYMSDPILLDKISRDDAKKILIKLESFGPWTRLQPLSQNDRINEVYSRAGKQLLIGLMEATTGLGFTQIIARDFRSLANTQQQMFLILVGFASLHRSTLSGRLVGTALTLLEVAEDVNTLAKYTEGVVVATSGRYSARHPVYTRELFEKVAPTDLIRDCLVALLEAFSDYEPPVIKNVGKADGIVFKSVINHRFVKEMMRDDKEKVVSVYKSFETKFHIDGLYWLQYGLALRDFGDHSAAFEKLKTAREAYKSPQIEHAYAQQLLIIASKSEDWNEAEPLLKEAIDALKELERTGDRSDTYPIVALAEGHITVVLKFNGLEKAKEIAKSYAVQLLAARKNYPSGRLDEALHKVTLFATTGSSEAWQESYGLD